MSDEQTLGVYADQADAYVAMVEREAAQDPMIDHFIAACPKGARVLDLGCGPGHYASLMAKAGLEVEAMDAVPEMVARADAREGVTAWQGRFSDLTAENRYDAIWAYFSLLHAPREEMPDHLAAIARALKPGGRVFIGLKRGASAGRDSLGRYYTYYEKDTIEPLLVAAGLTPERHWTGKAKGMAAHVEGWIVVEARA